MPNDLVQMSVHDAIATIVLNDPTKRNALSVPMFDGLDHALQTITGDDAIRVILLQGQGRAFCAGFDLAAVAADPALLQPLTLRLSHLTRTLKRAPQIVVASVHGAAIAGGCAVLSACDFVVVAPDAVLGYPVHRLGVSPAVTIPTLQPAIGAGTARTMLLGGELIDGLAAFGLGLATHVAASAEAVHGLALDHCRALAAKGPHPLRTTKAWINELEGTLDDAPFERPAHDSAVLWRTAETQRMLRSWTQR